MNFANYLENFTARIVSRYPETNDFIRSEKEIMLERFPELAPKQAQTEVSTYEKVKTTLKYCVDMERRQCYHGLDGSTLKRNNPEECIETINLISRATGNKHKDILFCSQLQGELLQTLKDSSTPEAYKQILRNQIDLSKTHANFLLDFLS